MGILERMRSGSDSTPMQVVLLLVILAFIGLNGNTFGDRSAVVVEVDGVKILETDYQRRFRQVLAQRERQRAMSEVEQAALADEVKQALIEEQVMLAEAKRLGLEVSFTEVTEQLLKIEFLRGKDGAFSLEKYENFLEQQGDTRDKFEANLREQLMVEKLRRLMATAASQSEPAVREMFLDARTTVNLDLVRVSPNAFESAVAITDADRTQWLEQNGTLVQETYDRDFERQYNHPERVQLRMIRLQVVPGGLQKGDLVPYLNKLREQIVAGADMAELAKRWSEDASAAAGGDLGLKAVSQLPTEVSHAVAGLDAGAVTQVVTTERDVRLIKVEQRTPADVDTLEEVRNAIADSLIKAERMPTLAHDFAEKELLPAWTTAGAAPADLVASKGLMVRPTGPIPTRAQSGFGPPEDLLEAARTAAVGSVLPQVFESNGQYYVAQLRERTEPDMSEYEANKAAIREEALRYRRSEFYSDWMAAMKAQASIQ
ncbi:MAG: SurA N-terminal domain-containing protein [Myxococcota bacterium]